MSELSVPVNICKSFILNVLISLIKQSVLKPDYRQLIEIVMTNIYHIVPSIIRPIGFLSQVDLTSYVVSLHTLISVDNRIRDELVSSNLFLQLFSVYDGAEEAYRRKSCVDVILSIVMSNREQVLHVNSFTRFVFDKILERFSNLATANISDQHQTHISCLDFAEYSSLSMLVVIIVETNSAYIGDIVNCCGRVVNILLANQSRNPIFILRKLIVGCGLVQAITAAMATNLELIKLDSLTVLEMSDQLFTTMNANESEIFSDCKHLVLTDVIPRYIRSYVEMLNTLIKAEKNIADFSIMLLNVVKLAERYTVAFSSATSRLVSYSFMCIYRSFYSRYSYWSNVNAFVNFKIITQLIIPGAFRSLINALAIGDNGNIDNEVEVLVSIIMNFSSPNASQVSMVKSGLSQLSSQLSRPVLSNEELENVLISWMKQFSSSAEKIVNSFIIFTLVLMRKSNKIDEAYCVDIRFDPYVVAPSTILSPRLNGDIENQGVDTIFFEWIIDQESTFIYTFDINLYFNLLVMLILIGRFNQRNMVQTRLLLKECSAINELTCRFRVLFLSSDSSVCNFVVEYFKAIIDSTDKFDNNELRLIFALSSLAWRIYVGDSTSARQKAFDYGKASSSFQSIIRGLTKSPNALVLKSDLNQSLLFLFILNQNDVSECRLEKFSMEDQMTSVILEAMSLFKAYSENRLSTRTK